MYMNVLNLGHYVQRPSKLEDVIITEQSYYLLKVKK